MINGLFVLTLFFLGNDRIFSQELNCNVTVNSSQIQGTNKRVFTTLEKAISNFMNNRIWTNNVFEVYERIECNLLFNITKYDPSTNIINGTLQVQSRRPVYGSSYNTTMLNYMDNDIQFKYAEFDPLEFSETDNQSNLTSLLAYYAYIIIGLDYDSFSDEGGTPYFNKAQKIVDDEQSSSNIGWKAFESRGRKNRYWLINDILSNDYAPLRHFMYTYHRLGLDVMEQSTEKGQEVIKNALITLQKFYDNKPDPFIHFFQVILDAKSDEIVKIFSEASPADKTKVYAIMTDIDPSNRDKYNQLKK